jgi:Leucine Rich repeat
VDRRSLQHLVDFMDNSDSREVAITELWFFCVRLSEPSDGGLDVLRTFFSRSDTTLTKVCLYYCNFGSAQDASQLLAAFETNRTVTDLTIHQIGNLQGVMLGDCLSSLLQNMPQLQRLACTLCSLGVDGVHAFQPSLQANRTLRKLNFSHCRIRDEGIRLIADALAGNMTFEILDIGYNEISSNGLDDITRILESTRLKKIDLAFNHRVFDDEHTTLHFAAMLHKNTTVQVLLLTGTRAPEELCVTTKIICARNQNLAQVNVLLAPPLSPPQQEQQLRNVGSMMLKTSHKAITKFAATVPNNAGASAIFKLFQARPGLLEKVSNDQLQQQQPLVHDTTTTAISAPYDGRVAMNISTTRGGQLDGDTSASSKPPF